VIRNRFSFSIALLFVFACYFGHAKTTGAQTISGVVRDQRRAPIATAIVKILSSKEIVLAQTTTDAGGEFSLWTSETNDPENLLLRVEAASFAVFEQKLLRNSTAPLEIILSAQGVRESVTVSVTRAETRLDETPASVIVLSRETLDSTAAETVDDALRQVPGFTLFRRAGSRTANPTTQGVSLRGVGASGASRALVLADGAPLNDPFGGWVYWTRVPREEIKQVEVLRGAASDLYGTGALGGVVQITTRHTAREPVLALETSYGSERTPDASLYAGAGFGNWRASIAGEIFSTNGYVLVDMAERGSIDTQAGSRHKTFASTIEREFGERGRLFMRGSLYGEDRANGTPLQTNDTNIRSVSVGGDWHSGKLGALMARAYVQTQTYDQSFSVINRNRDSETLSRTQRVPAQSIGFSLQWSGVVAAKHTFIAGSELREVRGVSDEIVYTQARPASSTSAGGRERTLGLFVTDTWQATPRLILAGGARFDEWRNFAARSTIVSLTRFAPATIADFPERKESAISPRASLLFKATNSFSLTASASRAFRQPTLNELYRSFRIGGILTLANENLQAERAASIEAGAIFSGFNRHLNLRSNAFLTTINRPVANVTLDVTQTLITRQRQNLGRTTSRGVELDTEMRLARNLTLSGGYLFADAIVARFPANIALENLRVPQVARHQFTFQARYTHSSFASFGVQWRAGSSQFDDDQNKLRLNNYYTMDALVSRHLTRAVDLFLAAENLFDNRVETGRTPVTTLAAPRSLRIGLRLRLGGD